METPLQIDFHNMDRSDAVAARVAERVDKLERFFGRLISCHVTVEAPHRRHHKGKQYHVRVELRAPGSDIVVSHDPGNDYAHQDVYVAVRDAFEAAERQLAEHAERIRADVKTHLTPLQGHVARLFSDDGYGFIATTDGQEIYFHRNSVVDALFEDLAVGQAVRLEVAYDESPQGPQATTVRPIGDQRLHP